GFDNRSETYADMLAALEGAGWKVRKDGKDLRCPMCAQGRPADVYEKAARTEAQNLMEIFNRDPAFIKKHYPGTLDENGILTITGALEGGRIAVASRYVDGVCTCCDGDASKCAPRHAENRSCD
ncbi:hypothetical protein LCGC14_2980520, partial [marine sediment metagenome]